MDSAGDFFKGWRRKIGLLDARDGVVLFGVIGSMRSIVIEDSLTAQCEGLISIFFLASKKSKVSYGRSYRKRVARLSIRFLQDIRMGGHHGRIP